MTDLILIIDSDPEIQQALARHLHPEGFQVAACSTGRQALRAVLEHQPQLVVTELLLPDMQGPELVRILRRQPETEAVPLLIFSRLNSDEDRIRGFELGADDYVGKPAQPREIVLRIQAIMRRLNPPQQSAEELHFDQLCLDVPGHQVSIDGQPLELTPTEFRLLLHLVRRQERVQTRDMLLTQVWRMSPSEIDVRTVDTHIRRLRQKLGPYQDSIRTVRNLGYLFKPPADSNAGQNMP